MGEPCPVCGSVHHPCPAQMTEGAPEKEELEKYRKETADVEKKTNDASFKANEKLVQLKALEEEIQKSVKSFDSSIQEEEIEKSLALIGQQMDVLEKSEKELQKRLEVAKEAVAEKQKMEAEIPELEQMQKKLQEEEQERKDQLLVSERDKANEEEQAVKVRGKLEFPEKTEAEQKIKELDKQKKEIDKNMSAAQKAFQDCSQSVEAAKTKKKTLEKQIVGNKEKLNAANAEATKIKNELNSITQDNLSNSQKISSVKKLIADFEKCFHSIPIVGGYQVSNTDYKKVCKTFQKIMLTGNDLDSKSAEVEEKLNSLAKVEEKLKRQEEVNDKKANELRVKEQNLLNRNSLLSVTELENASLKLKQQAYSSNVSEIVELLNKFFKGNIPLELKKVLLKAFQEVGLKPNEKLNLDTSDLDKTKNKEIERRNYFER